MKVGDTVRIEWAGHVWHGQRVRVVEVDLAFNLAPAGAEPVLAPIIFVQHPDWPEPCSVPGCYLIDAGSNVVLRPKDVSNERQGEFALL